MNLTVRRALAAATTTVALLGLAACGGDDSDSASDEPTTAASSDSAGDAPADDASGSADSGDEGGVAAEGEEVSADEFAGKLRDALDDATTAQLTMNLASMGTGEGDVDYTADPPELAMTMNMSQLGGEIEVRMVDGTIYMKGAALGGGAGWVSISLDDPNGPLGDLGSQLNPTQQFEAFADAVTGATFVGEEDVDGETLEHYTATVDTAKLLESSPQLGGAGATGMPDSMTQEWWFDGDGLIRKFTSDFGGGATGSIELALDNWGEDVSIEAPPADEVTPMDQMMGGAGGA